MAATPDAGSFGAGKFKTHTGGLMSHSSKFNRMFLFALLLSVAFAPAFGQVGSDQSFQCFPSCSETDARMLSLGGTALNTVAGFEIEIQISIPAGNSSFELGIFDGDTGKNSLGVLTNGNPTLGTWDQGTDELTYTLVADPLGDGSGTLEVAKWFGNSDNFDPVSPPFPGAAWTASSPQMPDNDWWNVLLPTQSIAQTGPGAPYVYSLRITNAAPSVVVSSSFKIRTTGSMLVRSPGEAWGVQAPVRAAGGPTARIVYPLWDGSFTLPSPSFFLTTPTTYDGTFTFSFDVPPNQTEIQIFDGDFDFGSSRNNLGAFLAGNPSGVALEQCVDGDDPNFSGVPAFALLANPEGSTGLSGNPPDDNSFDLFRRAPCVRYELIDPNGVVYRNNDPSGNFEWERFVVTSLPAPSSVADYSTTFASDGATFVAPGFLPAGRWRLVLRGLDTANTVFLNGPDIAGVVSSTIGDRVWLDRDGDGVQDNPADEPGFNGVVVRLYRDNGDGVFNPNPNPGMAFGFDTLVREDVTAGDGMYLFEGLGAGNYWVSVPSSNFGSGGALFGVGQTFDLNGPLDNRAMVQLPEASEILEVDFGYRLGAIGDLVWQDNNGNGIYEPLLGEVGIPNVRVVLEGDLNGDGFPETLETFTDDNGFYLFENNPFNTACSTCGLPLGNYRVFVPADNFNVDGPLEGATQTFDFDRFLDNQTTVSLTPAGPVFLDADFGYKRPCAPCDGKVSQLTLRYLGNVPNALVEVFGRRGPAKAVPLFSGHVSNFETFTFAGPPGGGGGFAGTLGTEISIFVNGSLNAMIHTSCSQPIGPGLIRGDFLVAEGYSKNGGLLCPLTGGGTPPPPPQTCSACEGKVSQLTLQYTGAVAATIRVDQKEGTVFSGTVNPGGSFTVIGIDKKNTLGPEISVYINGTLNTTIHTSCSQPIGPGLVRGLFVVVSGYSRGGGLLCPLDGGGTPPPPPPPASCSACDGKVSLLSLQYLGAIPGATIRVEQKKNSTVVFDDVVNPGETFEFSGTDKGTLGTEISVYVNGALNTKIHTSCSQPIGPGLVRGDFLVVEGYSKNGGLLCPLP